jgi:diguanylate cyclase (GGDEF)-like protein
VDVSAAAVAMAINTVIGLGLLAAALLIYLLDRRRSAPLWFAAAIALALVSPVLEFALPYLDNPDPARFAIFATFHGSLACIGIGIARHFGFKAPWAAIALIYFGGVALNLAILDMPRNSLLRQYLYQGSYTVMLSVAIVLNLRVAGRGLLEKVMLAAITINALQYLARPMLAAWAGGVGDRPQNFLGTDYLALTMIMFSVCALWMAISIILISVRDLMSALHHNALTDPMTGLLNRRGFDAHVDELVGKLAGGGTTHGFVIADIDHFKAVNDIYGHGAGDAVLSNFARILSGTARPGDIVARWGGEEFVIVIVNSDAPTAKLYAEAVRSVFAQIDHPGLKGNPVTASFGVDAWRRGDKLRDIYKRADEALYGAKSGGRNQVRMAAGSVVAIARTDTVS